MKGDIIYFVIIIALLSLLGYSVNVKSLNYIIENTKDTIYINRTDTMYIENFDSINKLNKIIIDNNNKLDSLKSAIFVYDYKLARIKEYNDIAGNGNNIKYLRGWINRVLKE